MKKALLYVLLVSYATFMLKPAMPTISDAIAHMFWYSHHIATVHYEHGKFHVHYDYMQASSKQGADKNTALPKSTTNDSEQESLPTGSPFLSLRSVINHAQIHSVNLPSHPACCDYPPPEQSA